MEFFVFSQLATTKQKFLVSQGLGENDAIVSLREGAGF